MNEQYELIVSNGVDADGHYEGTVLHDDENHAGKTIKVFYDSDRENLIERARKFVAWHRGRDESVEAIEL